MTLSTDELVEGAARETGAFDFKEKFWLARPFGSPEFAAEVYDRFVTQAERWESSPIANAIMNAYRTYHGLSAGLDNEPTVNLTEAGESGEFMSLSINHFRGLVRHQLALITADRPTWDAQARTSDSEAANEVELARNLMDYVMSAKRFDQKIYNQAELMKVTAAGFLAVGWDASLGVDGSGDIWAQDLALWEVAHERVRAYEDCSWWIFVRRESRWDWVAHFAEADPEKSERIAGLAVDEKLYAGVRCEEDMSDDKDRIPVLYLYANPSKACPKGRVAKIAAPDLVLEDGLNPYGIDSPIERMCPAEFLGTSTPFADSWSLLPAQEATDVVNSTIMTRLDLFGIPDVVSSEGAEYEQGTMGGANLIKGVPGMPPPQLLDLLQIPNSLGSFGEALKHSMEELSGINSVTRGNPSENITSGSMAALLQSMAIQFNSADERAYTFALEAIGTHVLRIYQAMATEDQVIQIAGTDEQWTAKTFKGENLKNISKMSIRTASALSKTLAGRKELGDKLAELKLIREPGEYLQMVKTGNLSPIFRGPTSELTIIKSENERARRGEPIVVMETDNHKLHIREHRDELNGGGRYDPKLSAAIQAHIQEHFMVWQKMSMQQPDLCMAIGIEPLPGALAIGQQVNQMNSMAPPPEANGPPAQETPNAVEQKAQPGPKPASPSGQPPSQAAPTLPSLPSPPPGA